MAERRKLTRKERETVYAKTIGHCAYCGIALKIENMQVDHVASLYGEKGSDTLENMLPACRSCNHYKSSMTLDRFRRMLETMPDTLMRDSVTYKNAVRYGLVNPNPHPVVFYFEKYKKEAKTS